MNCRHVWLLAFASLIACGGAPAAPPPDAARVSLIAVGDLGTPPAEDDEYAVAQVSAALAAEHARLPATALLLLGDNFYPDGLLGHEVETRIEQNLVAPLCPFLALDGPLSKEVAGACPVPESERHPVPVHAVLGNHDYGPGSADRQRTLVPKFLPGFRVPRKFAEVVDVAPGVSLILLETQEIYDHPEDTATWVTAAIAAAPGPWRIVVAHHPPLPLDTGGDAAFMKRGSAAVRAAVAEAQVPVQLWLAGHEHNLQLLEGPGLAASFVAISGSGSDSRAVEPHPSQRFAQEAFGFARVDWVADPVHDELVVVTLLAARGTEAVPIASLAIDVEGRSVERAAGAGDPAGSGASR